MLRISRFFFPIVSMLLASGATGVHAERSDRLQPMVVESDGSQAASVDLARKVTVLNGDVTITQGTLQIRAERVEIREESPGRFVAQARGAQPGSKPSYFKQKRDRVEEFIEAEADRVDYDGGSERVRFIGNAKLRVLRGGVVTDQANAEVITYDQKTDTLVFDGSAPGTARAASAPSGRARLVFVPRNDAPAAAPAAASGAAK